MTKEKVKRLRSKKSLQKAKDILLDNLNSNWIAFMGYDRESHVKQMKELLDMVNAKLNTLKGQA